MNHRYLDHKRLGPLAALRIPALATFVIFISFGLILGSCGSDDPGKPTAPSGTILIDTEPNSLSGPWHLSGPQGSLYFGTGDTIMDGMTPGAYRVTWELVSGWRLPVEPSLADTLADLDSLSFHGTFTPIPDMGSIAIAIQPDSLHAHFVVTGPNHYSYADSGSMILDDLEVGTYSVTWLDIEGWINIPPFTVSDVVTKNTLTTFRHVYTPVPCNCARLTIAHGGPYPGSPFGWELTRAGDENFFMAGGQDTLLTDLVEDYYFVLYKLVPGFMVQFSPTQQYQYNEAVVRVRENRDNAVYGVYVPDPDAMATITITPVPADLNVQWTFFGPNFTRVDTGPTEPFQVAPGHYVLIWGPIEGWLSPDPARVEVDIPISGTWAFRGEYLSLTPPAVNDFGGIPGDHVGEVILSWSAVENSLHPVATYVIAFSTEGPLDQDHWDEAAKLAEVAAVPLQQAYTQVVDGLAAGLVPGTSIWIAIRAEDDTGHRSPVSASVKVVPTLISEISGLITDHLGHPLMGLPLTLAIEESPLLDTTTDLSGEFHFPGVLGNREYTVETEASLWQPGAWFDYRLIVSADSETMNIPLALVPQYAMAAACLTYTPDFLTYLRAMTKTLNPTNNRPNTNLYKWDHWPLTVYLPEDDTPVAVDFQAMSRAALAIWNTTMPELYFTEADDPEGADVVFVYSDEYPHLNGQVSILEPQGNYVIGNVIPEKMEVYLNSTMSAAQRVEEVALHELGHVLGIADHSTCSEAGYLMYITSGGVLDNGPENAIHPDEQELVSTIRHLPQGLDMSGFHP